MCLYNLHIQFNKTYVIRKLVAVSFLEFKYMLSCLRSHKVLVDNTLRCCGCKHRVSKFFLIFVLIFKVTFTQKRRILPSSTITNKWCSRRIIAY